MGNHPSDEPRLKCLVNDRNPGEHPPGSMQTRRERISGYIAGYPGIIPSGVWRLDLMHNVNLRNCKKNKWMH